MAIMGFIIVVAGKAYSDSASMRIRSQNMLKSSEEAGRVAAILKEDISQMGAKVWMTEDGFTVAKSVYIDQNNDSSSYTLFKGEKADSLVFKKLRYKPNGDSLAVVEIVWRVENAVLKRKCTVKANADIPELSGECTTAGVETDIAKDIETFRFLPSKPGTAPENGTPSAEFEDSETLFPEQNSSGFNLIVKNETGATISTVSGTNVASAKLSGFTSNTEGNSPRLLQASLAASENTAACYQFKFEKGEEYAISFNMPYKEQDDGPNKMLSFAPGRDHLSIGLRTATGNVISDVPDFLFYPTDPKGKPERYFEFGVPQTVENACIAMTISFFSPAASGGTLDFSGFKIIKKSGKTFYFDRENNAYEVYNPAVKAKKNVKAFELVLGINKRDEIFQDTTVIPVPNNGIAPNAVPGGT